ncbi:MAG: glycosyltransferase [Candidatus Omnitrophica bacterium]|nr:glycosyltransferase [Candidatus Omnitrophota bacterium]
MTVSVIIPAYNAAPTIARTLEALACQDYKDPFEVIVVDDGSTDHTAAVAQSFSWVRCARQDNAGPAAARNHGARLAQGLYLCFTDSDCIPHPDWISCLLRGFGAKDIAVVCGSYGIANPGSLLASGIHGEIIFRHRHLMPDFPKAFGSYNFCVRKEVFDRVGGFQAGYRQASGEDNDLSYRILAAGGRLYFERQALVDHYHTTRTAKYLKEQFRHGFWRAKMYLEHPGMVKGDDYTFWKDVLEVPWAAGCVIAMAASIFITAFKAPVYFLFVLFLAFEVLFAFRMLRGIFTGFFFGFVMYVRAFSRAFGLSTGIFYFLAQKAAKIFK